MCGQKLTPIPCSLSPLRTITGLGRYVIINAMKIMGRIRQFAYSFFVFLSLSVSANAQGKATLEAPTPLNRSKQPDSTLSARPTSLTFTASTDQRFFFFGDTRNDNGRRVPVSVYGIRAGFLFPASRSRAGFDGGRAASFKAGAGFYFINQTLNRPGLLPNTSESVTRHLRIVTAYYERYLLRRNAFEVSLPLEIGYGHSRYERTGDPSREDEIARGVFIPLGVGVSAAYQFPTLRWFRPLHWFGFNVLAGYRFILKRDVPESNINYNGFYISVGPSFFLENLTADIKRWRQRRK